MEANIKDFDKITAKEWIDMIAKLRRAQRRCQYNTSFDKIEERRRQEEYIDNVVAKFRESEARLF